MQIIIEGCDGVGKSYIVNKLAEKYDLSKMRLGQNDPNSYYFYSEIFKKRRVVFDRSYISEFIYPPFRQQTSFITESDIQYLKIRDNPIIIFLSGRVDTLIERINKRGYEHRYVIDNLQRIIDRYNYLAKVYNIYTIDVSDLTKDEVFDKVVQYIEKEKKI